MIIVKKKMELVGMIKLFLVQYNNQEKAQLHKEQIHFGYFDTTKDKAEKWIFN